jgi:hypothetical protein
MSENCVVETHTVLRSRAQIIRMFSYLFLLNLIDVILTYLIISEGGRELNFLYSWLFEKNFIAGLVLVASTKLLFLGVLIRFLLKLSSYPRWTIYLLIVSIIVYIVVAYRSVQFILVIQKNIALWENFISGLAMW